MKTLIIIPAQIGSTRLPRKPLLLINDKPLICWVYDACITTGYDVVVATDNAEIASLVPHSIMTGKCDSGTDRVYDALTNISNAYDVIVNVQGDLPFVDKDQIFGAVNALSHNDIGTVVCNMSPNELSNPHSVKAIVGDDGRCKWFLRGAVSYGFHHLGIYAFTTTSLQQFVSLPQSSHEIIENLEQLRALDNGMTIGATVVSGATHEINTQSDLHMANQVQN